MMASNPENTFKNLPVVQSEELYQYILRTSVYHREPPLLKELREATASHPRAYIAMKPDGGQLMNLILKMINAKNTIEIGVFTGYSLLLTALAIPDDGKITALDVNRKPYDEIGLPIIQKARVQQKINFNESPALPFLDKLLEDKANEGSYDFAFVDADKGNYWNYHERLMKLVKIGGIVMYDNTLWGGTVVWPEDIVPVFKREIRKFAIEFNEKIAVDSRVEICLASIGDGITICRRVS